MNPEGSVGLLDFREDGVTPFMLFFKDGLETEKCVSVFRLCKAAYTNYRQCATGEQGTPETALYLASTDRPAAVTTGLWVCTEMRQYFSSRFLAACEVAAAD